MRTVAWLAPVAALALGLAACGDKQTVERPLAEAYMTLSSMPAEADAMALANIFPGTSYWVEPAGSNRVIWHFKRGSGEYGRYVADLSASGPGKTVVTTHFEEGDTDSGMVFLRDVAKIAADASVHAALAGQAVDRAAVQARIRDQIASNPVAAQVVTIEAVSQEMDRMAPPDPCQYGTTKQQNSWVCQKHGHTIGADGVIHRSDTGAVETSTDH